MVRAGCKHREKIQQQNRLERAAEEVEAASVFFQNIRKYKSMDLYRSEISRRNGCRLPWRTTKPFLLAKVDTEVTDFNA
ncbi:hypothetical protein D3C71_2002640 [compost metagenome]